jgi:aromatic ring-opening dioxygenase catalytic subunit (LigB family)
MCDADAKAEDGECGAAASPPLPVWYVNHGAGPLPVLGDPSQAEVIRSLEEFSSQVRASEVSAMLLISAHWEEDLPTVTTAARPSLLYDYYGFPASTYAFDYAPEGSPSLARRVRELLGGSGGGGGGGRPQTRGDGERGFDHGVFIPLMLMVPDASIPVVQLSLVKGLDPAAHMAMGRALSALRREGVAIVGSGMSTHNIRALMSGSDAHTADTLRWDDWLADTCALEDPAERSARLRAWRSAPAAEENHPREEHLAPLFVVAGAAGMDKGAPTCRGKMMGAHFSSFMFGGAEVVQ